MKRTFISLAMAACLVAVGFVGFSAAASDGERRMSLPEPATTGGKALMDVLSMRQSQRKVSAKAVPEQDLSNMLWAAWGVNRADGKRTIPTARNRQELEVLAVLESGVWRYDAAGKELVLALSGDHRGKYGGAPLTLLYAAPEDLPYGGMHAGSAYQNVALYCASAGLANVVKTTGAKELKNSLKLPSGYRVLVVQSVGWPE